MNGFLAISLSEPYLAAFRSGKDGPMTERGKSWKLWLVCLASGLALACLLMLLVSGPAKKLGWLDVRTSIQLIRWSAQAALVALPLSLIAVFFSRPGTGQRGFAPSLFALVVSGLLVTNALLLKRKAESVPPIHDISTDTQDPPAFSAVVPTRAEDSNSLVYEGEELAAQQKAAYPDLQPLELPLPPADAFDKARAAARAMGWALVAEDPVGNSLEATDTTAWFGFQDDVVVRVRAQGNGSRIDVRSVSRVGVSDLGKNAERIRAYFAKIKS